MIHGICGKDSLTLRVLIANIPTSLEKWLAHVVQGQQDIQIVGQVQGYVELLLAAQIGVDVVILCEEDLQQMPGVCSHLLAEYPEVKILLINPSGDKAMLYWIGQRQKKLRLASPKVLLRTLRQIDTLTNVI